MSSIEIFPKFAQSKCEASPCADITEIHAIASRILGEVKDCFTDEYDMCELTFGEQCALVKTLVDSYMLEFQYVLCKAVDQQAKQVRSVDCDAKSIVNRVLYDTLLNEFFYDILRDCFAHRCDVRKFISELCTALTPLFRAVPRLIVRFCRQCAVCAKIPETIEESLDEDWDDSKDELLAENEKLLESLLNRKDSVIYKMFCSCKCKTEQLNQQTRLIRCLQMRDLNAGVAGMSLGKRRGHDEGGSDGAGLDLGKRLRLRE